MDCAVTLAGTVTTGAVVSLTVTTKVRVLDFPVLLFDAVNVTVVAPIGKTVPLA